MIVGAQRHSAAVIGLLAQAGRPPSRLWVAGAHVSRMRRAGLATDAAGLAADEGEIGGILQAGLALSEALGAHGDRARLALPASMAGEDTFGGTHARRCNAHAAAAA